MVRLAEHPRVYGENALRRALPDVGYGTSPRVRGKLWGLPGTALLSRNIPACTGKTYRTGSEGWRVEEHPRVYGENLPAAGVSVRADGTSPRVRGKPDWYNHDAVNARNIPACTGKTVWPRLRDSVPKEHPRVYGENISADVYNSVRDGTSPRVRGKRHYGVASRDTGRNIPACTGKTAFAMRYLGLPWNIPACTGKTVRSWSYMQYATEHPRVYGENIRLFL